MIQIDTNVDIDKIISDVSECSCTTWLEYEKNISVSVAKQIELEEMRNYGKD